MSDQPPAASPSPGSTAPQTSGASGAKQPLSEAAVRALAEAAARRSEGARAGGDLEKSQAANEVGGRGGLEPTRYGDWEVNGIASDF